MKLARISHWCTEATRALAATLGDDADSIAADVNSGRNELWCVNDGKAWLVTCVADNELVICCVAGEGLAEIAAHFVGFARAQKLRAVRFFTRRPALKRLLKPLPVQLDGYVFRVPLDRAH